MGGQYRPDAQSATHAAHPCEWQDDKGEIVMVSARSMNGAHVPAAFIATVALLLAAFTVAGLVQATDHDCRDHDSAAVKVETGAGSDEGSFVVDGTTVCYAVDASTINFSTSGVLRGRPGGRRGICDLLAKRSRLRPGTSFVTPSAWTEWPLRAAVTTVSEQLRTWGREDAHRQRHRDVASWHQYAGRHAPGRPWGGARGLAASRGAAVDRLVPGRQRRPEHLPAAALRGDTLPTIGGWRMQSARRACR
jgi:hypothetical protein